MEQPILNATLVDIHHSWLNDLTLLRFLLWVRMVQPVHENILVRLIPTECLKQYFIVLLNLQQISVYIHMIIVLTPDHNWCVVAIINCSNVILTHHQANHVQAVLVHDVRLLWLAKFCLAFYNSCVHLLYLMDRWSLLSKTAIYH